MSEEKPEKVNPEQLKVDLQHLKHCQAILEDLPDLMIKARDKAEISQVDLGKELGVTYQQVSRDETQNYQNAATHKMRRALNATIKLLEQKIETKP